MLTPASSNHVTSHQFRKEEATRLDAGRARTSPSKGLSIGMAKRKSVTGLKRKKKPKPHITPTRRSDQQSVARSASPAEDILHQTGHGKLLQLKARNDRKSNTRAAKPANFNARVAHVSQKTIETKWGFVDLPAQRAIEQLLLSVHVPVLANFSSENVKSDAQVLLEDIRISLSKRLPRTPFPPKTSEQDFDLASLNQTNQNSYQLRGDATSRISRLRDEVEGQTRALRDERREIRRLETLVRDLNNAQSASHYLSPPNQERESKDFPAQINLIEHRIT